MNEDNNILYYVILLQITDWVVSRLRNLHIGVTDIYPRDLPNIDQNHYRVCGSKPGPFGAGEFIYINCTEQPLLGRYVIVQGVDMDKHLHICEVEVYTSKWCHYNILLQDFLEMYISMCALMNGHY